MVLFTSLNTALSGLNAAMAALQTTGHNIANASTPGYSRQRVQLDARAPLDMVRFQIGRGVDIDRIERVIDQSLEGRLRDSAATLGRLGVTSDTLQRLEQLLNALSDQDLGAGLDRLFDAIQDLSNNPADLSARSQVIETARTVAENFNYVAGQIRLSREQLNDEIIVSVDEINRITDEIADLNRQVLQAENGGVDRGAAGDLRDQRDLLVRQLSEFIGVQALETSTGEVNVLAGSAFLVFGQQAFDLTTTTAVDDGVQVSTPVFANGSATLTITNGKLRGLIDARDTVLGDVLQDLNVLANQLAFSFNRVQSTGQGLERFSILTSLDNIPVSTVPISIAGTVTTPSQQNSLTDTSLIGFPDQTGRQILILSGADVLERRTITAFDSVTGTIFLDSDLPEPLSIGDRYQITELEFPVVNGSFKFVVTNEITGLQTSTTITVDLDKIVPADTTLADIAAQINAALPGSATVLPDGRLRIASGSNDIRFSFAEDTSGFLAAIGLNVFFNGSNATTIAVNADLAARPSLLSAATSSNAGDNTNALRFAGLRSQALIDGSTLEDFYQGFVGGLGSRTSEIKNRFENQSLVAQQLSNQRERISGVNIDEEAVKMLEFQRSFQASARFISVIDELLETLINGL